ncbi:tail protein [Weizmannia phage Youna2]
MVIISGSLPADAYGFTYKGKHSGRDFDMWLTKSPIDFLVESIDALEDRPSAPGVLDFGANLGMREIELNLVIRATSEAELRQKRRAISSWLSPAKGLGELWWDTEPDKFYMARRYGSAQPLNMVTRQGEFTLTMVAPDPFAYSRTEQPLVITSPGTYTIQNIGNEEAMPTIEITGTNTSGTVSITMGGQTIQFSGALSAGDKAVIDIDDQTAYTTKANGNRINELDNTNDVFPSLQIGSNNVSVEVSGDFTINTITIYPNSRWS